MEAVQGDDGCNRSRVWCCGSVPSLSWYTSQIEGGFATKSSATTHARAEGEAGKVDTKQSATRSAGHGGDDQTIAIEAGGDSTDRHFSQRSRRCDRSRCVREAAR